MGGSAVIYVIYGLPTGGALIPLSVDELLIGGFPHNGPSVGVIMRFIYAFIFAWSTLRCIDKALNALYKHSSDLIWFHMLIFNLRASTRSCVMTTRGSFFFTQTIAHSPSLVFWASTAVPLRWFSAVILLPSGSCPRSRRYAWPAATSATWGTCCSWVRACTTASPATLPRRPSSTSTPPPREAPTNRASRSTSVPSASATRGKWWAHGQIRCSAAAAKEGQNTWSKNRWQYKGIFQIFFRGTKYFLFYYFIIMFDSLGSLQIVHKTS